MKKNIHLVWLIFILSCTVNQNTREEVNEKTQKLPIDIQGHRGARGLYPENSLIGFEKALEMGVTTLELDLCVSKDSQLVVSHEPYFSSEICLKPDGSEIHPDSAQELNMFQMTYEEISAFDCGSKGNDSFPDQAKMKIVKPLLSDVFSLIEKKEMADPVNYNIELKSMEPFDNIYHPTPDVFSDLVYNTINEKIDWSRITIQSFDFRVLQYFHEKYPHVKIALLIENELSWQENLDSLGFTPDIYSCYYKRLDEDNVLAIKYMEMQVIPWTVNNVEEMENLIGLGVDGLITDYPNKAIELVKEKNL